MKISLKMNKNYFFLTSLLLLLLIFGCKKEVFIEVEVDKEYSWQQHTGFLHSKKVQTNAFSTDRALYLLGINTFSDIQIDPLNEEEIVMKNSILYFNYPIEARIPITDNIIAGIGESSFVVFYPTKNPFPSKGLEFSLKTLDPLFASFNTPYYTSGECFGLSETSQNQCLIPYYIYDTTYVENNILQSEPNFYLINLSVEDYFGGTFIDTISCVRIEKENDWGKVFFIHTIEDNFYVTCRNKTMRIGVDGIPVTSFGGFFYRIFKHNDQLYALSLDELYTSTDNGLTWSVIQEIDRNLVNINYRVIDHNLIGYFKGQIFHFELSDEGFTEIKEVLNDGIENNQITSISKFSNKIYVTTLSGVFTKSIEDFLDYK